MNNFNLKNEEFRQKLIELINTSDLPISNVYFIFQLVGKEIEDVYNQRVDAERNFVKDQENQLSSDNIEE